MFGGLGVPELLLILGLFVLLFGARRIPQIARGLGEGIRNFKGGLSESDRLEEGERRPGDGNGGSAPGPEGPRGRD